MSTKTHNHVEERGALPKMQITNWEKYITISFKVGDHEMTSFIYPKEDESIGHFIARIRAEFVNLDVEVIDPAKY
jgi:hypothetical protein